MRLLQKETLLKMIRFYQRNISNLFGRKCRFYPSCSEYGVLAIKKYGPKKGLKLSVLRVLKCHPFHKGGVDLP